MYTYIKGNKTKTLISEELCPGVKIHHMSLEAEELGHMCCRMQREIHYIYIIRGSVMLQVNQKRVELSKGEGIFINSGVMHRLAGEINGGCELYDVTVSMDEMETDLLSEKYIKPILSCVDYPYQKLTVRDEAERGILESIEAVGKAAEERKTCHELEIKSALYKSWAILFKRFEMEPPLLEKSVKREADKLQKMLIYLHENYKEKLTLTQIAEALGVSSGDYCRFFKKHMGQTPFEYLQAYRIEQSIPELLEKAENIGEFSLKHGFNGSSYYAETFRKEMGCTPGEYRKWYPDAEAESCPLKPVLAGCAQKEISRNSRTSAKKAAEPMPAHLL